MVNLGVRTDGFLDEVFCNLELMLNHSCKFPQSEKIPSPFTSVFAVF